jgi:lysine-N-methylase
VQLVTRRAMTRFQCLGADCEDTCCRNWTILVDAGHLAALQARMTTAEERAELTAAVRRVEGPRHAVMVLRDDGTCRYLDGRRMCSIHARFGEELLFDGCAMYPRDIARRGDVYEMTGALSCPEAARQFLLHDDGLEPAPGTRELFGRGAISRHLNAADPYERCFEPVRELVLALLGARRHPVASRLGFVATLADRTRAALRRGGPGLDAPALAALGRELLSPDGQDALDAKLRADAPEGPFAVSVVRALLLVPAGLMPHGLGDLVAGLAAAYRERAAPLDGDPGALDAAYRALPRPPAELFERLVERYAVHHAWSSWYVKQDSFIGWVHALLARVALVRFVVTSQLAVAAEPLEPLFVRVVYNVTRLLEHNAELERAVIRGLEEQGLDMAHALALTAL